MTPYFSYRTHPMPSSLDRLCRNAPVPHRNRRVDPAAGGEQMALARQSPSRAPWDLGRGAEGVSPAYSERRVRREKGRHVVGEPSSLRLKDRSREERGQLTELSPCDVAL